MKTVANTYLYASYDSELASVDRNDTPHAVQILWFFVSIHSWEIVLTRNAQLFLLGVEWGYFEVMVGRITSLERQCAGDITLCIVETMSGRLEERAVFFFR